ncbi:AAA family ATPase [Bradyrhizobium jicamae]|uniref:AAA family ATPase n=1 Tax=Bradyrhizobium jicamae TaxID=280332 RepID=A0ABS5FR38_9BRAD|nr:adenylate/guanylate cyclase domain-containing protein [Bradyrhizobium jicamae]MBR0799278.1 AAA family ATPase [Bradyrhizobium jicamae]
MIRNWLDSSTKLDNHYWQAVEGAVMDVVAWLRSLGLGKYEAAFRENEIDETVLSSLTHETLKELGVTAVGHRLKLLDAIAAALRAEGGVKAPSAAPAEQSATPPSATLVAHAAGERRYVTVMFCDLVGSTSISAGLDAEDWRDLVGAYLDAACAAVTDFGGHVAKKLGDGLMALFGCPVAHENDAERAARAALSIQRALAEVNRKNTGSGKPSLNARIGIEIGPVVVDAAGEIYGDAPNIAARVQALAETGAVVVTARVQRQIAGLFVAEERGSHELKGVPEPVTLFRLIRASGGGRRAGQRHLTPLIGREEEIDLLMRRWNRARNGDGQLVRIVGEAGLGKSRLIEEFRAKLSETPHTWAEFGCSQLLQNTPLHPIADWGRLRFGGADVPAEMRLADLENTLALVKLDPPENAALLAPLLDIPLPADRTLGLPPEELRRRLLAALTNWWMTGARAQPAVIVVEDLHWADPTTLDLLRGIAEQGAQAPLLVLITARPEFRAPWGVRSHHSMISLAPLDRDQVQHMVGVLAARHALPKQIVDGVTERTGGVPLFVEEVTRLLLERSAQSDIQAIPPTLQQSLMARLDRLGSTREVAQIASVIGRDFSYALLRAVTGMDDTPLRAALDQLTDADILLVQGLPPDADYRFKHALIQDAAYENLLKSRRQALHSRIGETFRDKFAGTAAAAPELLAHHFTHGAMTESAIEWWGKAGQRSLERSALAEAVQQFTRALELIATLPATPALRRLQINLQLALITPLVHVKGYTAPETKEAVERARLLLEQTEVLGEMPGDPWQLFTLLYGFFVANFIEGNGNACPQLAGQFLALAEKKRASGPMVIGHNFVGASLMLSGNVTEARAHLDQGNALYDPAEHRAMATRFGEDQRIANRWLRSRTLWLLGYPQAASADVDQMFKDARENGLATSRFFALWAALFLDISCGSYAAANARVDEFIALADEKNAQAWSTWGTLERGHLFVLTGDASGAVHRLASSIAACRSMGSLVFLPLYLSALAKAHAELAQLDEACGYVREAMTLIETRRIRWCEADVNRVAGEIALKSPKPDLATAEQYFERALAIARQQQAKSWELRAAMSLARLWRDQGKVGEARELLEPVYGWFTEGFDTRDLQEAKALLAAFAS